MNFCGHDSFSPLQFQFIGKYNSRTKVFIPRSLFFSLMHGARMKSFFIWIGFSHFFYTYIFTMCSKFFSIFLSLWFLHWKWGRRWRGEKVFIFLVIKRQFSVSFEVRRKNSEWFWWVLKLSSNKKCQWLKRNLFFNESDMKA